jgi:hypothetical protein
MAKKSSIQRNLKRQRLVAKFAAKIPNSWNLDSITG